jgi:uroporphyrin-III C-methyltransferase/precorrin-2 dehydrogenase/sirohydrochlorin ferrochelatase
MRGRVTLVGAGPGDPELLTLKALRALLAADVILYDHLVSDEVLAIAPRSTRRVPVGKRGHQPGCAQRDINVLMVQLAREGQQVVRLKSGDPGIFGRAGEEIEALQAAGVPVAIVAGVTSATALAAAIGISLTHRDHAQAVRFVTGHSRDGALPEALDWRAIAEAHTTTVFYMAGRSAGRIAARLLGQGMRAATPVAVGASVSRPEQRIWYGTLATLAAGVLCVAADAPVLIVIGQVAACSATVRHLGDPPARAVVSRWGSVPEAVVEAMLATP